MTESERERTGRVLTVPNALSFGRILMIPIIAVLFFTCEKRWPAAAVILLSAITDLLDGWLARRLHQVTEVGRVLDPLADKLTQCVLLVCLLTEHPSVAGLLALLLIKEAFQALAGFAAFRRAGRMKDSRWFGKLSTALLYVGMTVLFIFPEMPSEKAFCIICLCGAALLLSLVGYGRLFLGYGGKRDGEE